MMNHVYRQLIKRNKRVVGRECVARGIVASNQNKRNDVTIPWRTHAEREARQEITGYLG